jgi:hypothetical protein
MESPGQYRAPYISEEKYIKTTVENEDKFYNRKETDYSFTKKNN